MKKKILAISSSIALMLTSACGTDGDAGGAWDYEHEQVSLTENLVIAAGQTVRVGPGTTFNAVEGVSIIVNGTLIAEGTDAEPVRFEGGNTPRSWEGIVIEDGAFADLTRVEIRGATYGIHAKPGADFEVDYSLIETSFKAALIYSDGTLDHMTIHASGDTPGLGELGEAEPEVDPDGTLAIIDGSPHVSHSMFDHSSVISDMIRIRGTSAATFDHVRVIEAHCAFHVQDAQNNSPRITNSVMEGMTFGIMAYAGKPILEDNVFLNNEVDVGYCYGATEDNTPSLNNNFYSSGELTLDAACARINTVDANPASEANPNAGPDTQ